MSASLAALVVGVLAVIAGWDGFRRHLGQRREISLVGLEKRVVELEQEMGAVKRAGFWNESAR